MHAELKALNPDLNDYVPDDPHVFGVSLQLLIGPKGQEGAEAFQITLCTPRWLAITMQTDDIRSGAYHLLVQEYNRHAIRHYLERVISTLEAKTWNELAVKIARFAYWEFENYQP